MASRLRKPDRYAFHGDPSYLRVVHAADDSGPALGTHGSFLGVWLGGLLYDRTGSYLSVWLICIALGIVATLLNLPVDERPLARLGLPQQAA